MRKFTSHLSLRGGGLCHRSNLFITGEIDFLAQVRNLRKVAIVCLLMAVGLAGCSRLVSVQQPVVQSSLLLASGQTIGQTFVAEFDGLASVQFYLSPQTPGDGTIFLHLRTDPQSPTDLGLAAIPVEKISAPGFYSFYFTPQSHSFKTSYYAFLEILGTGSVGVGNAAANAYLNGALYQDGTAVEAQSAFRLTYSRRWAGLGLVLELLNWVGVLLAGSFVFVLPGWGLLSLLLPGWKVRTWGEKLGLAAGTSLALYPLLMLWVSLTGLHLGVGYAWAPPLTGGLFLLWNNRRRLHVSTLTRFSLQTCKRAHLPTLPDAALLIILALLVFTRLWPIRTLQAPMWGDSVQHTVIAQLMVDNGGLFTSWEPYAPYRTLTVQYGFSSLVAVFTWLTGVSSLRAALLVGQLLNGLAVLALYPLAMRLGGGNRWAGVGTVLVAGLLSPMPAFYVNWGRYAQLAGQAILPVALWLLWETVNNQQSAINDQPSAASGQRAMAHGQWSVICLAALVLGGMLLAYYRMAFYYGTFAIAWLIGWAIPNWKLGRNKWLKGMGVLLLVGLVAALLVSPWMFRQAGGHLAASVEAGVTKGSAWQRVTNDYRIWRELFTYIYKPVLALGILGIVWALARRRWEVAALALWTGLLASIVALGLVRLPGANMMQSFAVLIALYIPVGLATGWLIGELAGAIPDRWQPYGNAAVAILMLVAAAWGAWKQRNIANPDLYALVTWPDLRALAWIDEHTPESSRFLVEGFLIYNGQSAVGADAGWWLPLVTRRSNSMPPQYALLNEAPIQAGYTQSVIDLVSNLQQNSPASPRGLDALCDFGITHVYVGQEQGNASEAGDTQLFAPQVLTTSQAFEMIYHQDRVYVFALKPEACP